MRQPPESANISSVGQLTSDIKRNLEDCYSAIWVKGEISNIRHQSSGHIYFSLKDDRAQISAVMFRGNAAKLNFSLKDGMEIIVFGNLSVYEPRGTYQLIVRECIQEGLGRLQVEFERLKRLLNTEGLFAPEKKQPIPKLPAKIAVVTSPTGAAIRDFLSILKRNHWNGEIVIFPAIVQGKEGVPDIIEKLDWVKSDPSFDLLIVTRGGGSIEDLWNFNEEAVVRAFAEINIPKISAIGHEIDFVLTDFAADKRAETPSAAAELICKTFMEVSNRIDTCANNLTREIRERLSTHHQTVQLLQERLSNQTPRRMLENRHLRLDELDERLKARKTMKLERANGNVAMATQRLLSINPQRIIDENNSRLNQSFDRLNRAKTVELLRIGQSLKTIQQRMTGLSIENVLNRGYAVVRNEKGKVVTSASSLKDGTGITLTMKDGNRKATIRNAEQLDLF